MARANWDLQGKVVLVTGGAGGIGLGTARELRRRGAVPVLADVSAAALDAVPDDVAPAADRLVVDVTDYAACERAVADVVARHGRLDVVWANAGVGAGGPVELIEPDVWARVVEVNLVGAFNTVRAALAAVIAARGYVAITASLASFSHAPGMSPYTASKAGVEAFADALRAEVEHQGVGVGCIHPTWIATDMVTTADRESPSFQRFRRSLPKPFDRTYSVDEIVGPLADGFAARADRIYLPGFVRGAQAMRSVINGRVLTRPVRAVVPELRRLFAEQAEREGSRQASWGSRPG